MRISFEIIYKEIIKQYELGKNPSILMVSAPWQKDDWQEFVISQSTVSKLHLSPQTSYGRIPMNWNNASELPVFLRETYGRSMNPWLLGSCSLMNSCPHPASYAFHFPKNEWLSSECVRGHWSVVRKKTSVVRLPPRPSSDSVMSKESYDRVKNSWATHEIWGVLLCCEVDIVSWNLECASDQFLARS